MRHLFLVDNTIDHLEFDNYKSGLRELNAIDRVKSDQFNKSPEAIHSPLYAQLYQDYSQENQNLAVFIEQLSTCKVSIQTVAEANNFCSSDINGFLGIDFSNAGLPANKSITDQISYDAWCRLHSSTLSQLNDVLDVNQPTKTFLKEFLSLSIESQRSVIDLFQRAKNRGLKTAFFPDTKIIKDVSHERFNFHVRELRIYTPQAIRVYFHEAEDIVHLAGITFKSSPNQSQDILKMYKRLTEQI